MKFSIAIPAFKAKFFKETLASCLNQTYTNFEIIVVDDASPENLHAIIQEFSDSRLHYYRNEKNCGILNVVDNWNICLSYCTGDYIICIGDDDRLLPNCLEDYFNLIQKYPDLGVYHSWTEIIDEKGSYVGIQEPRPEREGCCSLIWNRWLGRIQFIGDFCFDIKQLRQNGGFYKLPEACASDDISAVIAAKKNGIANTQTIGFQYRNSPYTISKGVKDYSHKLQAKILEKQWYMDFVEQYNAKTATEQKFLKLIKEGLDFYFFKECKYLFKLEFQNSPSRLFKYITKAGMYGLKPKDLIVTWIKTVLKKIL